MMGRPSRLSTVNWTPLSAGLNSMPACANALPEARRASSEDSSPGCSETISISARSGCPRKDCTLNRPRPAACASSGNDNTAARTSRRNATGLFTRTPESFLWTEDHNIMALGLQAETFSRFSCHWPQAAGNSRLPHTGVQQDAQHAPQRLRGAPKQLVADRERRQVVASHRQLAQPAHRDGELAGDCRRRELGQGLLLAVRHDAHPLIALRDDALHFIERHVLLQLD